MEEKKITLPSGAIAYIKPELTAGDYDDVQSIFLDGMVTAVDPETKEVKVEQKMTNSQIFLAAKYKLIEVVVIKLEIPQGEGNPMKTIEPITQDYVRNMSVSDVNFLKNETEAIKKLATISDEEKKN